MKVRCAIVVNSGAVQQRRCGSVARGLSLPARDRGNPTPCGLLLVVGLCVRLDGHTNKEVNFILHLSRNEIMRVLSESLWKGEIKLQKLIQKPLIKEVLGPAVDRRKGSDRRREIRISLQTAPALLSVAGQAPVNVQINDISRHGLGITSPHAILSGSSVMVCCRTLRVDGIVLRCKQGLTGEYTVGIVITKIVDERAGREI